MWFFPQTALMQNMLFFPSFFLSFLHIFTPFHSPSPTVALIPSLCPLHTSPLLLSASASLGLDARLFSLSAHLWITHQEIMWHNWITSGYRGFTYCWGIWRMLFFNHPMAAKMNVIAAHKETLLRYPCCPWGSTANAGFLSAPGDVLPRQENLMHACLRELCREPKKYVMATIIFMALHFD